MCTSPYSTFAVALMRIESTLLNGRFITGCAGEIRADFCLEEANAGRGFALTAHTTETLIASSE